MKQLTQKDLLHSKQLQAVFKNKLNLHNDLNTNITIDEPRKQHSKESKKYKLISSFVCMNQASCACLQSDWTTTTTTSRLHGPNGKLAQCLSLGHNDEIPDLSIEPATFRLPAGALPIELLISYTQAAPTLSG